MVEEWKVGERLQVVMYSGMLADYARISHGDRATL
jgi:hypothetical protein